MSVVAMTELLQRAVSGRYAIGYFESWDQYSLEAAIEAAEESSAPAIIGFGGAVTNQVWLDHCGVETMAGLARCLAEKATVPTAVLFNEARTLEQLARGLRSGCNTLMLDTSALPNDQNLEWTRKVVELAHSGGAAVEAELGHLADGTDPAVHAHGTDPVEAAWFVRESGVDALAVSIGNVHLLSDGEAKVDLDLLSNIHQSTTVPLVIHGGTGYPAAAVKGAIERGVAKFNVGTRLKQVYLNGIADAISRISNHPNIHRVMGSRELDDVFVVGKSALKSEIKRMMNLYGTIGQAQNW